MQGQAATAAVFDIETWRLVVDPGRIAGPVASGSRGDGVIDLKLELWAHLRRSRSRMLAKLDGLSEYDRRRPLTPTGTNLLGLVKHLAGEEYGYLGESFGRPPAERPSWFRDDPYTEVD